MRDTCPLCSAVLPEGQYAMAGFHVTRKPGGDAWPCPGRTRSNKAAVATTANEKAAEKARRLSYLEDEDDES